MKMHKAIPAAVGVYLSMVLAGTTPGQDGAKEPGKLGLEGKDKLPSAAASQNQKIAEDIAERLRSGVQLGNSRVDILFAAGMAELTGMVADAGQRDEVLRVVQATPGVERVRDRLMLARGAMVAPAQGLQQQPIRMPLPVGPALAPPAFTMGLQPPPLNAAPQEPVPVFQAPPGPNPQQQPPPMPPYAWPSYAPYNNLSRVAYPETYPHSAWPFIGPMYPYPKVPLGWRKVSLEWQDGYWWYSRGPTGHDWWRIRYW
jgi:hypothetical protein